MMPPYPAEHGLDSRDQSQSPPGLRSHSRSRPALAGTDALATWAVVRMYLVRADETETLAHKA